MNDLLIPAPHLLYSTLVVTSGGGGVALRQVFLNYELCIYDIYVMHIIV